MSSTTTKPQPSSTLPNPALTTDVPVDPGAGDGKGACNEWPWHRERPAGEFGERWDGHWGVRRPPRLPAQAPPLLFLLLLLLLPQRRSHRLPALSMLEDTIPAAGAGSGVVGAANISGKTYAHTTRVIKPGGGRMADDAGKELDIALAILAVFTPPLAVGFKLGLVDVDVCLTLLACTPGVLYARDVIGIQHKSRIGRANATAYGASARAKNKAS